MNGAELIKWIRDGGLDEECLLLGGEGYREKLYSCIDGHCDRYGEKNDLQLYSAPGRTELGGSYLDLQNGRAIAAAIDRDILAAVSPNSQNVIRVFTRGKSADLVDLCDLRPKEREKGRTAALIRGVAARMKKLGFPVAGFDAYILNSLPAGMGLGGRAALEVLIADICNHLFCEGALSPIETAMIARTADLEYFGLETALTEQTACAAGDCVALDFADPENPSGSRINFDLAGAGYRLAVVRCGEDRRYLEEERESVPADMRTVAQYFGKPSLRQVDETEFYASLPALRRNAGDRVVLSAVYFYSENRRVGDMKSAVEEKRFEDFFRLTDESGYASFDLLQSRVAALPLREQGLAVGLSLARKLIGRDGGCRIHGAVSGKTLQAYLREEQGPEFKRRMDGVFGEGSCIFLKIRKPGCIRLL